MTRIASMCAAMMLSACATLGPPPCAPEIRLVEVERRQWVPVPADLTRGCHAPQWPQRPLHNDDLARWIDGATRTLDCYAGRMAEIATLTGRAPEE